MGQYAETTRQWATAYTRYREANNVYNRNRAYMDMERARAELQQHSIQDDADTTAQVLFNAMSAHVHHVHEMARVLRQGEGNSNQFLADEQHHALIQSLEEMGSAYTYHEPEIREPRPNLHTYGRFVERRGHKVKVVITQKEVTIYLDKTTKKTHTLQQTDYGLLLSPEGTEPSMWLQRQVALELQNPVSATEW